MDEQVERRNHLVTIDIESPRNNATVHLALRLTVDEVRILGEALRREKSLVGRYGEGSDLEALVALLGWEEVDRG